VRSRSLLVYRKYRRKTRFYPKVSLENEARKFNLMACVVPSISSRLILWFECVPSSLLVDSVDAWRGPMSDSTSKSITEEKMLPHDSITRSQRTMHLLEAGDVVLPEHFQVSPSLSIFQTLCRALCSVLACMVLLLTLTNLYLFSK
jgi:hypothetical protein